MCLVQLAIKCKMIVMNNSGLWSTGPNAEDRIMMITGDIEHKANNCPLSLDKKRQILEVILNCMQSLLFGPGNWPFFD